MKLYRLKFIKLVIATLALPQMKLLANGRKPVANVSVKGTIHREGMPPKEVYNIRIVQGGTEKMEITGSDGDAQINVKLSKIKTLVFLKNIEGNPSSSEWEVTTQSGQEPLKMVIATGSGPDKLLIRCLQSDGSTLAIPLAKCVKLELSAQGEQQNDPSWPVGGHAKP